MIGHLRQSAQAPSALEQYEGLMRGARAGFLECSSLREALDQNVGARRLHELLMQFCALGFQMTRDVESWIQRAGERCLVLGYAELGKALVANARHEAGHEQMFVRDTRVLAAKWNQRWSPEVDAEALLARPSTDGIERYRRLHEQIIGSEDPYCQIAVEYEIEAMTVRVGGTLLGAVAARLGTEFVSNLSFVVEHVALDQGHAKCNAQQLEAFLSAHPDRATKLATTGAEALAAYGAFLDDCRTVALA